MLKKILKNPINFAFVLIISILYVSFITIDIFFYARALPANYLKFASVVLCFLLAVNLYRTSSNKSDSRHVVGALIFTMIADIFLLFNLSHYAGVLSFSIVQLIYQKRHNIRFFIFGMIVATLTLPATFILPFEHLHIAAGAYAILILTTFVSTFWALLPRFNLGCIRLGMILFILCDIHVALYNQLPWGSNYYEISAVAIWIFYLPSQLLLALSAYHPRESDKNTKTIHYKHSKT